MGPRFRDRYTPDFPDEDNSDVYHYDRTTTNEDDGRTYYGIDDGEGHTTWMDEDGNIDTSTPTPRDEDEW